MESSGWLFPGVETRGNHLWVFPKVSNTRNLGGILRLTISRCGNSWKPREVSIKFPMRKTYVESSGWLFPCVETRGNHLWGFPKASKAGNRCGILRLTVNRCGNSWKPPVGFPQSSQSRKSRWNSKVDCSEVWKLVEITSEVSPKVPKQGIYVESSGWLFPGVETRGNHLWGFPQVSTAENDVESTGWLFPGVETRGNHL